MIKEFFTKKENLFIILVGGISIACITLGFVLLFLKPEVDNGPRRIPNSVTDIVWADFDSDIIEGKLQHPEYMQVREQKEEEGVGINLSEFEPREFLTYFSNQNHVSIYPDGLDTPFFYGKTRENEYTSSSGQGFIRTEFLTVDGDVWAVMLVPKEQFGNWQSRGFVWIQTRITNRLDLCISTTGVVIDSMDCDPYAGNKTVYDGEVTDKFIRMGYEVVNKNSFK